MYFEHRARVLETSRLIMIFGAFLQKPDSLFKTQSLSVIEAKIFVKGGISYAYYYGPEYSDRGHGYSRHSIGDRVVSMMEKEMDMTESPYEREELKKFIRMVRSAADN